MTVLQLFVTDTAMTTNATGGETETDKYLDLGEVWGGSTTSSLLRGKLSWVWLGQLILTSSWEGAQPGPRTPSQGDSGCHVTGSVQNWGSWTAQEWAEHQFQVVSPLHCLSLTLYMLLFALLSLLLLSLLALSG